MASPFKVKPTHKTVKRYYAALATYADQRGVNKKNAGRELDGRTYDGMPAERNTGSSRCAPAVLNAG